MNNYIFIIIDLLIFTWWYATINIIIVCSETSAVLSEQESTHLAISTVNHYNLPCYANDMARLVCLS